MVMWGSDSPWSTPSSSAITTVDLALFPGAFGVRHKPYRLAALFDTIRDALDG
jgi:hypothetical protein